MRVNEIGQMGPMHPTYDSWVLEIIPILLGIIIALLLILIVYLWINQNNKQISKPQKKEINPKNDAHEKIDIAIRLLNDNEKLIVQSLLDNGGEMLQKDISTELGLSRVQTHRSIQSLIEREMVTTEDYFNTKKVTLSKWLLNE